MIDVEQWWTYEAMTLCPKCDGTGEIHTHVIPEFRGYMDVPEAPYCDSRVCDECDEGRVEGEIETEMPIEPIIARTAEVHGFDPSEVRRLLADDKEDPGWFADPACLSVVILRDGREVIIPCVVEAS